MYCTTIHIDQRKLSCDDHQCILDQEDVFVQWNMIQN